MPKAAVDLGAVREVLHINRIGKRIVELLNNNQYSVSAKIEHLYALNLDEIIADLMGQ